MKTAAVLAAAAFVLTVHDPAQAESGRSLGETRLEIIRGTSPGITLIPARTRAQPPAASASSPSAAASMAGTPVPAATAPVQAGGTPSALGPLGAWLRWGDAPSGTPMRDAKRLDSPSVGIELPTAATNAKPAGDAAGKAK